MRGWFDSSIFSQEFESKSLSTMEVRAALLASFFASSLVFACLVLVLLETMVSFEWLPGQLDSRTPSGVLAVGTIITLGALGGVLVAASFVFTYRFLADPLLEFRDARTDVEKTIDGDNEIARPTFLSYAIMFLLVFLIVFLPTIGVASCAEAAVANGGGAGQEGKVVGGVIVLLIAISISCFLLAHCCVGCFLSSRVSRLWRDGTPPKLLCKPGRPKFAKPACASICFAALAFFIAIMIYALGSNMLWTGLSRSTMVLDGVEVSTEWCSVKPSSWTSTKSRNKTIAIVGAGFSGISAARDLTLMGFDVILLEAKNRTGGRLFTDESGFERGGQWIHFHFANPVYEIAKCLDLETPLQSDLGRELHEPEELYPSKCEAVFEAATCQALANHSLNGEEAFQKAIDEDTRIQDDALRERCSNAYRLGAFELAAAPWDSMAAYIFSASFFAPLGYGTNSLRFWRFGDRVIFEGYSAILNGYLAQAVEERLDVRLEAEVSDVEHGETGTTVRLAGSGDEISADAVLVTVPLGALKAGTIAFSPPLPDEYAQAIDRLGFGLFNKVWLTFDDSTTPTLRDFSTLFISPPIGANKTTFFSYFVSMEKQLGRPVVLAFTGGKLAEFVESASSNEVGDAMIASLRTYFPSLPNYIEVDRSEWSSDPQTRGSYSHIAVGSSPDDMLTLSKPVNDRLFFAGEHTIRYFFQSAQGAYLSGRRAAARIDRLFPAV